MEDEGLAPGTVLDGKFRIVRCLGSGGMGAVYEVRHELTRHRRALKLLHPGFATQQEPVERFLREASVAGRIDNPHITEIYDAGWLSTGAPYVVMEYLEGETVGQKIEREGALPLDFVLTVMSQTCRGLDRRTRRESFTAISSRALREDPRLRHQQVRRPRPLAPDAGGRFHGHPLVHVAGAVPRRQDRRRAG